MQIIDHNVLQTSAQYMRVLLDHVAKHVELQLVLDLLGHLVEQHLSILRRLGIMAGIFVESYQLGIHEKKISSRPCSNTRTLTAPELSSR